MIALFITIFSFIIFVVFHLKNGKKKEINKRLEEYKQMISQLSQLNKRLSKTNQSLLQEVAEYENLMNKQHDYDSKGYANETKKESLELGLLNMFLINESKSAIKKIEEEFPSIYRVIERKKEKSKALALSKHNKKSSNSSENRSRDDDYDTSYSSRSSDDSSSHSSYNDTSSYSGGGGSFSGGGGDGGW